MLSITTIKQLESLNSTNKKVLVHFHAEWCPPCKLSKKLIESQSLQPPQLTIVEVNIDESQQLTDYFKIQGVPTLIFLGKNLNIAEKLVGCSSQKIKSLFKKLKHLQ